MCRRLKLKKGKLVKRGIPVIFLLLFLILLSLGIGRAAEARMNLPSVFHIRLHYSPTQDITVTATPLFGVADFTATYITDQSVQLDWSKGGSVETVVIAAKYDEVPTGVSDGYIVYDGSGIQTYDNFCNLNETFSTIYYVLYTFDAIGDPLPYTATASMENPLMAELSNMFTQYISQFLVMLAIIAFVYLAEKKRSNFLQILAGMAVIAFGIFWISQDATLWYNLIIGASFICGGIYMMIMVGYDLIKGE